MPTDEQALNAAGRRARCFRVLLSCVATTGSSAMLVALAGANRWWMADLAVQVLGPAWIAVGMLAALAMSTAAFRCRSWLACFGALLALASSMALAMVGWSGRTLIVHEQSASAERPSVSIVQVNLNARSNNEQQAAIDALVASAADVVVVTEFPSMIWRQLREPSALSEAYPHFSYRDWVPNLVPGCLVLSRWPIERLDSSEVGIGVERAEQVYLGRIETRAGPLVLAQIAPHSPRSASRWQRGNAVVASAAQVLAVVAEDAPVVLACDLNSTPMGHRGRMLRRAGLAPGKPALRLGGTWPAGNAGIARLALDDVWVAGGAEVVDWRSGSVPGSDHLWAWAQVVLDDRE